MQVIALRALKQFWKVHQQAEIPLRTWYANASQAVWSTPQDIKNDFGGAVDLSEITGRFLILQETNID